MDVPALRRRLLAWYRAGHRPLPWRGADVYGVWVSEVMLQQTRVDVAAPYWRRWMARFPTLHALAAAAPDEVARAWAGLGYYSRARNLHAAARRIAADGWPTTLEGWLDLPGCGPYTAAAVTSIAMGQPNACVDGNVVRVVARLADERRDVTRAPVRAAIAGHAQAWLTPRSPGDWNQAMMDLGATVCTPKGPRCGECPVAHLCAARAAGTQATLPRKTKPKAPRDEERTVAVVRKAGRVLLVRPRKGLLAGMWSLPGGPSDPDAPAPVEDATLAQAGVRIAAGPVAGTAVHQFSHRTWRMTVREGRVVAEAGAGGEGGAGSHDVRWVPLAALPGEALPAATRVALAAAGVATKAKTAPPSERP